MCFVRPVEYRHTVWPCPAQQPVCHPPACSEPIFLSSGVSSVRRARGLMYFESRFADLVRLRSIEAGAWWLYSQMLSSIFALKKQTSIYEQHKIQSFGLTIIEPWIAFGSLWITFQPSGTTTVQPPTWSSSWCLRPCGFGLCALAWPSHLSFRCLSLDLRESLMVGSANWNVKASLIFSASAWARASHPPTTTRILNSDESNGYNNNALTAHFYSLPQYCEYLWSVCMLLEVIFGVPTY